MAAVTAGVAGAVAVGSAVAAGEEGRRAGSAAGRAAQASQAEARRQFRDLSARARRAEDLAKASPQELRALTSAIDAQERGVARQEQLIGQIDPAIIEASQQALKLLRGEETRFLAPVRAQRKEQRQRLLNTLRAQLGPGAETSTAGIQALNQFDSQTDQIVAQTQSGALSQLGAVGGQFAGIRPDITRTTGGLGQLAQQRGNISARESEAAFAGADLVRAAGAPLIGLAGADFVAPQLQAQARASTFSTIGNLAGQVGGAALGGAFGGGGGGTPSQAPGGGVARQGFNLGFNF